MSLRVRTCAATVWLLVSCNSDSRHILRAGPPGCQRCSSVTHSRCAPSSRLASRAPRSGIYVANHCYRTLAATGPQALDAPRSHQAAPLTRQVALMGTWAALTTYAGSRAAAVGALDAKVRILEQTEAELSTWRPTSALSQINRLPIGTAGALDPPLCRLLERVQHWQRRTAGAFDPAIGALIAAWDLRGAGRIPTGAELAVARARAGWTYVAMDGRACLLRRRRDVTLDAGAFGKGEALDRILATGEDVGPWLVDLGGQVAVSGPRPDGSGWRVALAHAGRRHLGLIDLELRGGSLATSGGAERDLVVGDRRVGHVIDPRSGRPAPFNGSVTVWHERALAADILSTALFVMGPTAGLRWAERHDVAALFQVPDGASAIGPLALRPSRAFVRKFLLGDRRVDRQRIAGDRHLRGQPGRSIDQRPSGR